MQLRFGSRGFLLAVFFFSIVFSTTLDAQVQVYAHGDLIKYEQIGSFDKAKLTSIVNEELSVFLKGSPMPFEQFKGRFSEPACNINLYKITYQTFIPEKGDKPTIATGLVAIPDQVKAVMPLISYQHGTVFGKQEVPSYIDQSMETKLMLAQFGGQGYIVIGADYIGMGDSKEANSYFAMKSTEQACMDMYTAATQFLKKKQIGVGHFFTVGWSQGGYNNMVFLRALEREGINVTASATASAPVDLSFFIVRGITNPRPFDAVYSPACLSNMIISFEEYYKIPGFAASIIRPEYLDLAKNFYNFKIDFMPFLKRSTGSVQDFVKPEFIIQIRTGNSKLQQILNESEAYRWVSKTPLRAYSGMKDEAVPEYLARLAVDYQALLGKKNGQAINAGEKADHRATYVYSVIDLKPWFDSFLK